MRINVSLPFDHLDPPGEFVSMDAVAEIGALMDKCGYYAGCVTDHPCPTGRWLDNGGHHAQDPFVMLGLLAAFTKKMRLQTGILVLPYRNPFITARSVATLDAFSGGRVSIGMGAGYLKGEYKALGVDHDQRNEIFDEYLKALKAAFGEHEFTFKGQNYEALGNRILPLSPQRPHPPLLIGGNSKRAIRRAVELGDAWYPFFTPAPTVSATARTTEIVNEDDLPPHLDYLREYSEQIGREKPPEVYLGSIGMAERLSTQEVFDRIGKIQAMGIEEIGISFLAQTRRAWCDEAQKFAENVIAKLN